MQIWNYRQEYEICHDWFTFCLYIRDKKIWANAIRIQNIVSLISQW